MGLIKGIYNDATYRRPLVNYMLKGLPSIAYKRASITVSSIIRNNLHLDDVEILLLVKKYIMTLPINNCEAKRSKERAEHVMKLVDHPITRYLDYGCGNGQITRQIGALLGAENIVGVDVGPGPIKGVTYIRQDGNINAGAIGWFDLITAFVSFHHIENIDEVLGDIAGMLAPGGTLVIREHDSHQWEAENPQPLPAYLNIIHAWISVWQSGSFDTDIYNHIHYRRAYQWDKMMKAHGLVLVRRERYSGNNPQELYYACYQKK